MHKVVALTGLVAAAWLSLNAAATSVWRGMLLQAQLDPSTAKEWADAATAPTALVIICMVIWRVASYLATNFVTPLGGTDGKIAQFLDASTETLREMPREVAAIRDNAETVGKRTEALLKTLVEQHNNPDASGFGTNKTNAKLDAQEAMLKDLMSSQLLLTELIERVSAASGKLDEQSKELLRKVQHILGKHV